MSADTLAERAIIAAGGTPKRCPVDGTVFDPRKSYGGHRTNRERRYCSETCKGDARNARERARRAADPLALRRMRADEKRGQLPLPGTLELPHPEYVDPIAASS